MNLPKAYEPKAYETDIYALWEKSGAFAPSGSKGRFSIVMPPPNANGDLHIGHALTIGIEDILTRYNRMQGKAALFLPGADHAGFETQVVYEKELAKQGKSRFDYKREELYKQIWDFVEQNKSNYEAQIRSLGASCDWSKFVYTLDEKIVKRAYATFKKMWDDGLAYRGERLVNFCTHHGTAFADIEVAYKEVQGKIWHISYPLTDGSGEIVVATTRPETMLGDTAVAVNPKDNRYKQLVGKTVKLPLTNREIPIITDDFVDQDFGTGAVKVTPAHDQNDFDLGERHDLPKITVIDHEGRMTHEVPQAYRGMLVDEARKAVVEDLERLGNLKEVKDHINNVGHCYKCDTVLQPLLKEQWFISMKPLTTEAIKALKADKIQFHPANKKDQLIRYFENLRDWNISRQIAWGIPIPAFVNIDDSDDWIYDERVEQESIEVDGKTYRRDPDVFDTWFSSSSWPYATLEGEDPKDLEKFYPLNVMETGEDILYPWVSRMISFGLYNMGKVPFDAVYLHGIILDEKGAKMSKSKGNVVNPMDILNEFGSDALRMGIIADESPASRRPFDSSKFVGARNFCNKIWNIARFIEGLPADSKSEGSIADDWILSRLESGAKEITEHLEAYRFAESYETLYHLVWDDLADWYIEANKISPNREVLTLALETVLKLAHPFAPFVTETIWQAIHSDSQSLLITESWPDGLKGTKNAGSEFELVKTMVTEVRSITNTLKLRDLNMYYTEDKFVAKNADLIKKLARLGKVSRIKDGRGLHLISTNEPCWLDIDFDAAISYASKLKMQLTERMEFINQLEKRLDNKSYVKNAPKQLVDESKQQLSIAKTEVEKIKTEITRYSSIETGM